MSSAAETTPSADAEPNSSTAKMSAIGRIADPACDSVWPTNSRRNSRSCRAPNRPASQPPCIRAAAYSTKAQAQRAQVSTGSGILRGMTPLLAQRSRQDRQFERIYRRHAGDVYRYALAVLRNPDDAEDVTQTTFMNAYRAFQRGDRPEAPKNWLIAIAHNVCRQRFRQASRRPNEVEFVEETAPAPEEVEERYSIEDIQRALGQLAFNQRSALVMRELEGRSYSEIAGILGVTVGAVETLIFRARRALREQLEGSVSWAEAELALSRQADGMLPRAEKGALRAHLRECAACATAARRMRAQRGAFKALGAAPLPGPLVGWVSSLFGGSAAATGSAIAVKAAAVTAAGLLAAGGGVEGKRLVEKHVATAPSAARAAAKPRPSAVAKAVSASSIVRAAPTVVRPPATNANGR